MLSLYESNIKVNNMCKIFLMRMFIVGKRNVIVIAHDFDWPAKKHDDDIKRTHMKSFRLRQPKTFECCSLAMICGKLDDRVEIDPKDWENLEEAVADIRPRSNIFPVTESVDSWTSMVTSCLKLFILPLVVWYALNWLWYILNGLWIIVCKIYKLILRILGRKNKVFV